MKILTKKEHIKGIPERWKNRYFDVTCRCNKCIGEQVDREAIYNDLSILISCSTKFDSVLASKIDNIIGNSSWTSMTCDVCDTEVDRLIVILGSDDHFALCEGCIDKAKEISSG